MNLNLKKLQDKIDGKTLDDIISEPLKIIWEEIIKKTEDEEKVVETPIG